MNVEALVVGSADVVAFDHARRSASQPRALQDTAVRNESRLSPDHSGRAGAVSSAYLRGTGSTDKSQGHCGKTKCGSALTSDAQRGFRGRRISVQGVHRQRKVGALQPSATAVLIGISATVLALLGQQKQPRTHTMRSAHNSPLTE
jgi:hypothetical protein